MIKIVIVGAGLSGLTTAYKLSKRGNYNVTLLEKSDYLGGRVRTVKVNNIDVNVGGFIIFPWYKYLRDFIRELDLENKLIKFNPLSNFWLINEEFIRNNSLKFNLSLYQKILLFLKFLPYIFNYPTLFYKPKGNEMTSEVLQKVVPKTHTLYRVIKAFFEGFTYQSLNKLPFKNVVSVFYMILFGGNVNKSEMFNSNELILTLKNRLISKNVNILTSKNVTSIVNNEVSCSDGSIYEYDKLILATPNLEFFKHLTNISEFDTTHFYAVIIELNEELKINNQEWSSSFHEPIGLDYEITSMINLEWMTFKKLNRKYILVNLKSLKRVELSKKEISNVLQSEIYRIFKKYTIEKIHNITYWEKNMPVINNSDINSLRGIQGKNNIYFTGDFMSFPSMESAVYNAMEVVKLI